MHKHHFLYFGLAFLLLTIVFSCKKDGLADPNFRLGFSTDTLSFDTVFVTLGSTTEFFAIRNNDNQPVTIGEIRLEGGDNSVFRINVDGITLPNGVINDIIVQGNDSIYIFVEVTVNPDANQLPFLIEDQILFETNGNQQSVILQAYGQNANFFNDSVIQTQTWTDDLPYVILNSVLVEECHTLTIEEGVDIYFGGNSAMFVAGNLEVKGEPDSMVTFRGVRLDDVSGSVSYDDIPGQWNGVYLLRNDGCSVNSSIKNAEIRNAQFGLIVGTDAVENIATSNLTNGPQLDLENVIIQNHSVFGILGINSTINAKNVLMYQSGSQLLALQLGGNYNFEHCTFYNRGSQFLEHQDEVLFFSNYFVVGNNQIVESNLEQLNFTNCIIYGTLDNEIFPDTIEGTQATLNYTFDHCLLKSELDFESNNVSSLLNFDPQFFIAEDPEEMLDNDFRLASNSPCVNAGNTSTSGSIDIAGTVRDANPDIGVYEFLP